MRVVTLPSEDAGEVLLRPGNRRHSREFKQRVVAEYDALPKQSGDRGSFLRGHRLGRHQISVWRRELEGATADKTGGVPVARRSKRTPDLVELERLRTRNAKLEAELSGRSTATTPTHVPLQPWRSRWPPRT